MLNKQEHATENPTKGPGKCHAHQIAAEICLNVLGFGTRGDTARSHSSCQAAALVCDTGFWSKPWLLAHCSPAQLKEWLGECTAFCSSQLITKSYFPNQIKTNVSFSNPCHECHGFQTNFTELLLWSLWLMLRTLAIGLKLSIRRV